MKVFHAIMEAMHGKLIMANNIPGINSLIRHGHTGILINDNASQLYIKNIEKCF